MLKFAGGGMRKEGGATPVDDGGGFAVEVTPGAKPAFVAAIVIGAAAVVLGLWRWSMCACRSR